ncbi:MAG: hypothetical protein Q8P84_07560 [Deltaproteobacteria bacterium]|nr:hypothetical protein [Deltaproteobacteria bacterium]
MKQVIFPFILLLALVAGGVRKLPCVEVGFGGVEHDCCAVETGAAFSNPSEECCGSDTDKGLPVLGASLPFQIDSHLVLAATDIFQINRQELVFFTPLHQEHWGGIRHLPSYLEHATLLL